MHKIGKYCLQAHTKQADMQYWIFLFIKTQYFFLRYLYAKHNE